MDMAVAIRKVSNLSEFQVDKALTSISASTYFSIVKFIERKGNMALWLSLKSYGPASLKLSEGL